MTRRARPARRHRPALRLSGALALAAALGACSSLRPPERAASETAYVPAIAASPEPAVAAARAVAAMVGARPVPPSRPGFGAGSGGVVEGLRFADGSDELLPGTDTELARIAEALRERPAVRVAIVVHADDAGSEEDSLTLSRARAARVLERLVDLGIEPARLEPEGHGERLPCTWTATPADRARNRRVELRILRGT